MTKIRNGNIVKLPPYSDELKRKYLDNPMIGWNSNMEFECGCFGRVIDDRNEDTCRVKTLWPGNNPDDRSWVWDRKDLTLIKRRKQNESGRDKEVCH